MMQSRYFRKQGWLARAIYYNVSQRSIETQEDLSKDLWWEKPFLEHNWSDMSVDEYEKYGKRRRWKVCSKRLSAPIVMNDLTNVFPGCYTYHQIFFFRSPLQASLSIYKNAAKIREIEKKSCQTKPCQNNTRKGVHVIIIIILTSENIQVTKM